MRLKCILTLDVSKSRNIQLAISSQLGNNITVRGWKDTLLVIKHTSPGKIWKDLRNKSLPFWKKILESDESDDRRYFCLTYKRNFIAVKPGGENVIIRGAFSWHDIDLIV